jgi:hypothetical protein
VPGERLGVGKSIEEIVQVIKEGGFHRALLDRPTELEARQADPIHRHIDGEKSVTIGKPMEDDQCCQWNQGKTLIQAGLPPIPNALITVLELESIIETVLEPGFVT